MLDSNPPAPPAIQGFQADEIFYKGCHGDLPWEDHKTAIRAFTGTDVEAARLTHQQVVALLMMLGRRSDALIVELQSVLVSNDAILKQNEAMTAVLKELVDVVKQQPVHTLEVADLEVLGDRITGAIGDLQTGMAATVKSAGLRTSEQVALRAPQVLAESCDSVASSTGNVKEKEVAEMISKLAHAIVMVDNEAGPSSCNRKRVFAMMVKTGTFDFSQTGLAFDQLLQEAEKRSFIEVSKGNRPDVDIMRLKLV